MDLKDYEQYVKGQSNSGLIEIYNSIDEQANPERFAIITEEIERRKEGITPSPAENQNDAEDIETLQNPPQTFFEALAKGPDTIDMAERIVMVAVYLSVFIMVLTFGFAFAGLYQTSEDETLQYLLDPALLIDVSLMAFFTLFLYKHKLWASIALLVQQLLGLIMVYVDLGKLPGGLAILKILLFVAAVRAVYFLNKNKLIPEPENT